MVKLVASLLALALLGHVAVAQAEPTPPTAIVPAVHHAPVVTARLAEPITIDALIDRPDHVRRALLVFRGGGSQGEVEFERSSQGTLGYVAVIPAAAVRGDLTYAIELETTSGEHLPVFATRSDPHHVAVLDSPSDRREAALLSRLEGRRSVVQTSGEYATFGRETATLGVPGNPARSALDRFYRVEGSYTYRLLGTVSEFGIRFGAVRGRSLVPGEIDSSKYDVGLNYGAPRVRIHVEDWLHVEGELLTSVTEVGFSVGGGGAVLLGDAYGSKLVLGFEGIQVFGVRAYSRLDLAANSRLTVSPIIEVTTMPHADRAGVRLLAEAGFQLGRGFAVQVRGGYQARTFDQGGPTLGGGLAYAF